MVVEEQIVYTDAPAAYPTAEVTTTTYAETGPYGQQPYGGAVYATPNPNPYGQPY